LQRCVMLMSKMEALGSYVQAVFQCFGTPVDNLDVIACERHYGQNSPMSFYLSTHAVGQN